MVYLCRNFGLDEVADYWEQVVFINNWQRVRISSLVIKKLFGTVSLKKIAILGFSFKANTNDTREAASNYITKDLIDNGQTFISDPKVNADQIESSLNIKESRNK